MFSYCGAAAASFGEFAVLLALSTEGLPFRDSLFLFFAGLDAASWNKRLNRRHQHKCKTTQMYRTEPARPLMQQTVTVLLALTAEAAFQYSIILFWAELDKVFLVHVRLRTEVLRTPSLTRPGFKLMTVHSMSLRCLL